MQPQEEPSASQISPETDDRRLNDMGIQVHSEAGVPPNQSKITKFGWVVLIAGVSLLVFASVYEAGVRVDIILDEMVPPTTNTPLSERIPRKIWAYRASPTSPPSMSLNQQFISEGGYEVIEIHDDNFQDYLNDTATAQLNSCLEEFHNIIGKNLGQPIQALPLLDKWRVMDVRIKALHVLEANGGVMLDQNLTLTQSLDWIYDIDSNQYANRVNRKWPTEVVGFMGIIRSSEPVQYTTEQAFSQPRKVVRERPSLTPALIAASKHASFISRLCLQFQKALRLQDNYLVQHLQDPSYYSIYNNGYYEFMMASRRVIDELHARTQTSNRTLLVDTLGLSLINSMFGPEKLILQLMQYHDPVIFKFYADVTFEQLQLIFGPLRYALYLGHDQDISDVIKGRRKVMENSLMHRQLPSLTTESLYRDPEVSTSNSSAPEWETLPKIVWTIWLTGYDSASTLGKLGFAGIKQRFESRGYTVNLVTLQNAREFIDDSMMAQIERITSNTRFVRFGDTTTADLIRLALLVKHGGVYIDMSSFLIGDIDWIKNIARMPSHMLVNRFSELPKVLCSATFYTPLPPFWSINQQTHTKQALVFNFENFFIVAEKESEYLKLVLQQYMRMLETPSSKIYSYLSSLGLEGNTIVWGNDMYLLEMQAMQTVLLEKQRELDRANDTEWINAAHYFGMWSIFSPFGPSKHWRLYSHLEDVGDEANPFLYAYSQNFTQGLIGPYHIPFIKLVGAQSRLYSQAFSLFPPEIAYVSQGIHPRSVLKRYMDEFGLDIARRWNGLHVVQGKN